MKTHDCSKDRAESTIKGRTSSLYMFAEFLEGYRAEKGTSPLVDLSSSSENNQQEESLHVKLVGKKRIRDLSRKGQLDALLESMTKEEVTVSLYTYLPLRAHKYCAARASVITHK